MSSSSSTIPASLPPWPELPESLSEFVDGLPVSGLTRAELIQRAGKRAIDIAGAGLGLLLLAPLLLLIGLLIRLTSRGPVIFCQTRLGKDRRPFSMYKFRTMVADAEERLRDLEPLNESHGGVLFKMNRDPRVTRFGRILRQTNLDELPQLFNILKGEMSLVGPRPLQLRDCVLLARAQPDAFGRRHEVVPGLTGLWQVSDRRQTDHVHMVGLDLDYLDRWSLGLDLWLIVQTLVLVLTGRSLPRERSTLDDCPRCTADSPV